jgi:hypothetical protein
MTLGRVRQLPTSRGQAGYRAQAMFTSRRALANEVGMPLLLLGRGEEFRLMAGFASGATAVTALVIADAARFGISGAAWCGSHQQSHQPRSSGLGPDLA